MDAEPAPATPGPAGATSASTLSAAPSVPWEPSVPSEPSGPPVPAPPVVLLGPQRRPDLAPVLQELHPAGPVATVSAGWLDRELDDAELTAQVGGDAVNLALWHRRQQVLEADPELAAADTRRRELLEELADLYLVGVDHAEQALREMLRRTHAHPRALQAAVQDSVTVLHDLDERHLQRVAQVNADFYERCPPHERDAVVRHRQEVADLVAGCGAVAVAGGHVGALLDVLHLLNLGPLLRSLPVVAWSAGAMVLTERVVLFNDRAAAGRPEPEVHDAGLSLVRGTVALPHARRRLHLDDTFRAAALARRFAPARCLPLDPGTRVTLQDGRLPQDAVVVAPDGTLAPLERARHRRPPELVDPADHPRDEPPAGGPVLSAPATARSPHRKLAINRLRERDDLDEQAVDAFLAEVGQVPVVEGSRCTFLFRGEADEVHVRHRIVNQPQRVRMRPVGRTSLWAVVIELPEGSRVEYQLEVRRGEHVETGNDPLNPWVAHSPVGSSSVCQAAGYTVPDWVHHDPDARPGTLHDLVVDSQALRRQTLTRVYLPARYRPQTRYPLLVVHDGDDYLHYAALRTVLDNLVHRLDMAEVVVALTDPGERTVEYADAAAHARFVTAELLPRLAAEHSLLDRPSARCLMGASFGAVASLSVAHRHPGTFGSLLLQSGSFVSTDIGAGHDEGEVFDPVVRFVNRFRADPHPVVDRAHVSCGVYEPLIVHNRSLVPVLEWAGIDVRYVEARDGHSWENWRDRLRDALTWLFPGPAKYLYE